uniref:ANIS5_cation-bd domain-containing protein n=1 Tax=Haemonchus contortus TaxID=6289 RepID=A0A7I4YEE1_HAECO
MKEMNDKVAKLIDALPMALKNFTAIMKNDKQMMPQMVMAMERLMAEHPLVFHVLMSAMKEVMHEHGPRGPQGPHSWTNGGPYPFDGHRMKLLVLLFIGITAAHHFFPLEELHHPPFLDDVSRKAQEHYYKILFNEKLSITQQKGMIMAWAKKNNVREEVKSFYGKIGKRMEEMNDKVGKLIGALPMALKNFTAIMKNENQTMPQMMMALERLKAEHPPVRTK